MACGALPFPSASLDQLIAAAAAGRCRAAARHRRARGGASSGVTHSPQVRAAPPRSGAGGCRDRPRHVAPDDDPPRCPARVDASLCGQARSASRPTTASPARSCGLCRGRRSTRAMPVGRRGRGRRHSRAASATRRACRCSPTPRRPGAAGAAAPVRADCSACGRLAPGSSVRQGGQARCESRRSASMLRSASSRWREERSSVMSLKSSGVVRILCLHCSLA